MDAIATLLLMLALPGAIEPPVTLAELAAFPPRHVTDFHFRIAIQRDTFYQRHVDMGNAGEDERHAWDALRQQAHLAWDMWGDLQYIHASSDCPENQLCRLRRMRSFLGYANYYHGTLPMHAPPWPFDKPAPELLPLPAAR